MSDTLVPSIDGARRRLWWFLVACIYALMAIWGVVLALAREDSRAYLIFALASPSAMALWIAIDARRNNLHVVHVAYIFVFFFWPLAVPVYLIWSRGARGLCWAAVHALALYALIFVSFNVAIWVRR